MILSKSLIIAVDFDGTIVKDCYPNYPSEFIPGAKEALIKIADMGHLLILNTLRDHGNQYSSQLEDARKFLYDNDLDFILLPSHIQHNGWKLPADIFIDDKNVGGLPPWDKIVEEIRDKTYICTGEIK